MATNATNLAVTNDGPQTLHFDCHNTDIGYPFHGLYRENWFIIGTLNLILSSLTLSINILTLIALRRIKGKNTVTNYILRNLCATDMFTGLFGQTIYGALYLSIYYKNMVCSLFLITVWSGYFFVTVSFFTLFLIQTERYIAVFYPFRYEKFAADWRFLKKIILITWIGSGIIVSASFFTPHFILISVFASLSIPTVLIWSCYVQVKIVRQVRKISRRIQATVPKTGNNTREMKSHLNRVNSRANRLAGLILLAYFICYTPNGIINILLYFSPRSKILITGLVWTETIVFLNSIFNALLFCLQKRDVRCIIFSLIGSLIPWLTTTSSDLPPAQGDNSKYNLPYSDSSKQAEMKKSKISTVTN